MMREPFVEYIKTNIIPPFLLITCGLPATLKTTVGKEVARITCALLLRSDVIRRDLLKNEDIFDVKVAGDMGKRTQVYDEMFRQAQARLGRGESVILDATFITRELRRLAAGIAAKHRVTFVILQTECPEDVAIKRILARDKKKSTSNAVTEEAYFNNKNKFEAIDAGDLKKTYPGLNIVHFIVDTSVFEPKGWFITGEVKI